ncbi:MAG: hypothetical protein KDB61_16040 [Planctomycetes bacterium]|nr:hypothetical protein [Planctomycetota bacterium]
MRFFLPLAITLLASCASDPQPTPEPYEFIGVQLGANRVIFPANLASQVRFLGYESSDYWTPSEQEVLALDARLADLLREAMANPASVDPWVEKNPDSANWIRTETQQIVDHLPEFRRQFAGIVDGEGHKRILVRGFPSPEATDGFDFPRWREEIVCVSDGGFWYWYAVYDLETGKLVRLSSNGYA